MARNDSSKVMLWGVLGAIASILSFIAALVLLTSDGGDSFGDLGAALGFYFLAKSAFLGPMLYLTGRIAAKAGDARVDSDR